MAFTGINLELGNYVQFPRLVLLREPEKSQSTECAICHDRCHYRPGKNEKDDSMAILPVSHPDFSNLPTPFLFRYIWLESG